MQRPGLFLLHENCGRFRSPNDLGQTRFPFRNLSHAFAGAWRDPSGVVSFPSSPPRRKPTNRGPSFSSEAAGARKPRTCATFSKPWMQMATASSRLQSCGMASRRPAFARRVFGSVSQASRLVGRLAISVIAPKRVASKKPNANVQLALSR